MSNVINLFKVSSQELENSAEEKATLADKENNFELEIKLNEQKKERLREERLNANKSVLRSYRIKS